MSVGEASSVDQLQMTICFPLACQNLPFLSQFYSLFFAILDFFLFVQYL